MAVPATFAANLINGQPALTYSWHADHKMIAIDHILTSSDIIHTPETYTSRYIEAQKDAIDHFALFGSMRIPVMGGDRHVHRIEPCYCRVLTRDATRRHEFSNSLRQIPVISYDVEPTTHAWALTHVMHNCAKKCLLQART